MQRKLIANAVRGVFPGAHSDMPRPWLPVFYALPVTVARFRK